MAWYGPIVMNTQEQLRQAFDELERGHVSEAALIGHSFKRLRKSVGLETRPFQIPTGASFSAA